MRIHRENTNDATRVALVTVLGIAVIAILYTFAGGINGNDFWWHIKVGEWIVENREIPASDIFSWYGVANQIPWTAHEWLADVILYILHLFFGEKGIYFLSLSSALAMAALLWNASKKYIEKNILIGGLYFVLFAVTTSIFFYGRPHIFSFFLLYWQLSILFSFWSNPNSKSIYLVPLITCLWSNVHGGSASLSYLLCFVFFVISLLKIQIGIVEPGNHDRKAKTKLLLVSIGALLAVLINPNGLNVLLYPYKNFGDNLQMTLISEWRAPDAKNIGDLLLFIFPVALLLLGFITEGKKIRLIDLAITLVFVLLFFRSVRFIMLWYIAAAFFALPYVPVCKIKPVSNHEKKVLLGACAVLLVIGLGASTNELLRTAKEDHWVSATMSDEAIDAIKADAPERIFNDYNLGEALIYHEIPVFFDARADLYAYDNIMADGVSLMFLEQANSDATVKYVDVDSLLQKYCFDSIVILKVRPLYSYLMSHTDQFEIVFEDDTLGYFRIVG